MTIDELIESYPSLYHSNVKTGFGFGTMGYALELMCLFTDPLLSVFPVVMMLYGLGCILNAKKGLRLYEGVER